MKSKQITASILTLAIGLTSAGMAMAAPSANGVQSAAKTQVAPATKADKKTTPAQKVTDPALIKSLNHETVVPLLVEAEKRYFYALGGGTGEIETFTENGKEYRYLSADIDTKDELLKYLMKSYTKQASEFFIKKFIIVHEGRLAQLNADTGNLLEFERSTAKMISMTPTKRVYKINVPFPKEVKESSKYILVKFEKVGDYWRVDTAPHLIF